MRIKQLNVKTAKQDQTRSDSILENMMERAGFIRKQDNIFFLTPLGLLLRNTLEKYIFDVLQRDGFMEAHIPISSSVASMTSNIAMVNNALVSSYKDLPMKFYYQEMIKFNKDGHKTLWRAEYQKVIAFSTLGETEKIKSLMEKILDSLFEKSPLYEGTYFCPMSEAKESYRVSKTVDNLEQEAILYSKDASIKVKTPGKKTVHEVCDYLSIKEDDLLKTMIYSHEEDNFGVIVLGSKEVDIIKLTRVLGFEQGSVVLKEEKQVKESLLVSPGFIGPGGLKVTRILIDRQVIKDKPYVAGANEEDFHVKGIIYGRDYKGDFYDLTKSSEEERGWSLGENREELPKVRVQNALSGLDYAPLEAAYINIDRLMLGICHQSMRSQGFDFPKNIGWFDAVITVVDARDGDALEAAEKAYETILDAKLKVIIDDRKDRLGSKYRDYDLISIPHRIIIGKNFHEGFELKDFYGNSISVNFQNLVAKLKSAVLISKKELLNLTEEKNETL